MFERPVKAEHYRQLVKATEYAPVSFECIPPTSQMERRARRYIYRAASSLGVRVRVRIVDEHGALLPPGELNVIRVGWQLEQEENS